MSMHLTWWETNRVNSREHPSETLLGFTYLSVSIYVRRAALVA